MKTCFILFGPPCSGKSYYIHTNKIENKTVSFDKIRHENPDLHSALLYERFYQELSHRLSQDTEDIYVDMVLHKPFQLKILKNICNKNNYNIKLIDIGKNVNLDTLIQRNAKRHNIKLSEKDLKNYFNKYLNLRKEKEFYEIIS